MKQTQDELPRPLLKPPPLPETPFPQEPATPYLPSKPSTSKPKQQSVPSRIFYCSFIHRILIEPNLVSPQGLCTCCSACQELPSLPPLILSFFVYSAQMAERLCVTAPSWGGAAPQLFVTSLFTGTPHCLTLSCSFTCFPLPSFLSSLPPGPNGLEWSFLCFLRGVPCL